MSSGTMKLLGTLTRPLGFREGIIFLAVVIVASDVANSEPSSGQAVGEGASIYGIRLQQGYGDWTLTSVARGGGPLNDMCAKLGNDVAIRAFNEVEVDRGGHLAGWDQPELFASELRAAFRSLREAQ